MFKYELGNLAVDIITGITGTLTARCQYINGCIQYCLKPMPDKDGKEIEGNYIDETQIRLVPGKSNYQSHLEQPGSPLDAVGVASGGPQHDAPEV
jgi:hypothetical protein